MKKQLICLLFSAAAAFAADAPTLAKVFDGQVTMAEHEIVPLAEAMPADKYNFKPTGAQFTTVRTFALEVKHLATVLYQVASAAQEEKMPVDAGKEENGAASLQSKEQIVQYLKDAFAYTHKAANKLTVENELNLVKSPFGDGEMTRISAVSIALWHSFDHYGQMAIFARMNGVVPPASAPSK